MDAGGRATQGAVAETRRARRKTKLKKPFFQAGARALVPKLQLPVSGDGVLKPVNVILKTPNLLFS
jgi:hypothetical protein